MTADYKKGLATGLAMRPLGVTSLADGFYLSGIPYATTGGVTTIELGSDLSATELAEAAATSFAEAIGADVEKTVSTTYTVGYTVRLPKYGENGRFYFFGSAYSGHVYPAAAVTSEDPETNIFGVSVSGTGSATYYLSYLITDYTVAVNVRSSRYEYENFASAILTKKNNGENVAIHSSGGRHYSRVKSSTGNLATCLASSIWGVKYAKLFPAFDWDGVPYRDIYAVRSLYAANSDVHPRDFYVSGYYKKKFAFFPLGNGTWSYSLNCTGVAIRFQ